MYQHICVARLSDHRLWSVSETVSAGTLTDNTTSTTEVSLCWLVSTKNCNSRFFSFLVLPSTFAIASQIWHFSDVMVAIWSPNAVNCDFSDLRLCSNSDHQSPKFLFFRFSSTGWFCVCNFCTGFWNCITHTCKLSQILLLRYHWEIKQNISSRGDRY